MRAAEMTCPHCKASMQGDPIPDRYRQHGDTCEEERASSLRMVGKEMCWCFPYGDATHFSRVIGHEVRGVYDGVLFWQCPDCHLAWPRWDDGGGRLTDEARAHVAAWNAEVNGGDRK